jgi:uncharacterized membrane protein
MMNAYMTIWNDVQVVVVVVVIDIVVIVIVIVIMIVVIAIVVTVHRWDLTLLTEAGVITLKPFPPGDAEPAIAADEG